MKRECNDFMDTVGRERAPEIDTDGLVGPCKVQGRDGKVGEKKDENQTAGRVYPSAHHGRSCASIVNMLIGLSRRSSRRALYKNGEISEEMYELQCNS